MARNKGNVTLPSREFGESIKETASLSVSVSEAVDEVRRLRDSGSGGAGNSMIRLGAAMVMFPEPTMVSDVAGCGVIAAGVIYNQVVPPPLYLDDIFETVREQVRAIHEVGEEPCPIDILSRRLREDNR